MKRRLAVLDLGTNTFHLVIADVADDKIVREILAEKRDVKLGEGGITKGLITDTAFERGMEALHFFKSRITEANATEVYAAGTAALRNASNGPDFVSRAKQETGIDIKLIDGTREAELIYNGVKRAVDLSEPALIMDIGGGSVEFIFCDKHEIFHKKSYPLGAALLRPLFHHSDPVSDADILAIHQYLDEQLTDLKINGYIFKPQLLIGSAGAFETYADLVIKKFNLPPRTGKTNFIFNSDQFHSVIHDIIKSSHAERSANELIIPIRVDMIVVSAIVTSYIITELQIPEIAMSAYSLKEGLMFDKITS